MSQSGKLTPNLDHSGTKFLNLTVLQRMDSCIKEILMTAAHVAFYEFNIESNQWSRKDVEGSLFVVKRNSQPRFQFIVMNRRSTDNLVESLLGDFEFEVQNPYLLYRNANQEVNGLWFYNAHECEEVASLFSRILNAYSKVPSKPQLSSNKSEFEKLEAVPTMAVMEGPLEPSPTSSTTRDVCEESSLANFFNVTMNMAPNASNGSNSVQSYHAPSNQPIASHAPVTIPSHAPTLQLQSFTMSAASTSSSNQNGPPETIGSNNRIQNLFNPSSFFTPPSSTPQIPMLPVSSFKSSTLQPPTSAQHSYGIFPPPSSTMSITPSSLFTPTEAPVISRDKIRDALIMLAQDDQFIDMLYQALTKVQRL